MKEPTFVPVPLKAQPGEKVHVAFHEQPVPERREWYNLVDEAGFDLIRKVTGSYRDPDLTIEPDGTPYLYRWHLIPRNEVGANVYLHLQVADDPERPLHDHPWDNQSVILAGGYREIFVKNPCKLGGWYEDERFVRAGQVVQRRAEEAHRLFLLKGERYAITLFSTGPVIREWGFWFVGGPRGGLLPRRWRPQSEVIETTEDGRSIFKEPEFHG